MKHWVAAPVLALLSSFAAPAAAEEALVHVEARTPVRLESRVKEGAPWETACKAPCDQPLDDGVEYRFVDDGGPRAPFRFHAGTEASVTLRHEPRTATAPALIGVGGIVTAVGVVALAGTVIAANDRAAREADPVWSRSHDPGMSSIVYLAYGVLSVVLILGGGSMVVAGVATNAYDDGMTQRRPRTDARRSTISAFPLGFTF